MQDPNSRGDNHPSADAGIIRPVPLQQDEHGLGDSLLGVLNMEIILDSLTTMRTHMSKGSTQRPIFDRHSYESNWDSIFGKKNKKDTEDGQPEAHDVCDNEDINSDTSIDNSSDI